MLTCGKFRTLAAGLFVLCVSFSLDGAPVSKRPLFGPVGIDLKFLASPRIKTGSYDVTPKGRLSLYNNRWASIVFFLCGINQIDQRLSLNTCFLSAEKIKT